MEEEEGGWVERKQLMKTELLLNEGRGEYGGGGQRWGRQREKI